MCNTCVKHTLGLVLVVECLIVLVMACVLLGISIHFMKQNSPLLDEHLNYVTIYSTANSAFNIISCIFGCVCAIWTLKQLPLKFFAFVLFFLTFSYIILSIYACVATYLLKTAVTQTLEKMYLDETQQKTVDKIQASYYCCGLDSSTNRTQSLPDSCCAKKPCTLENSYKKNCLEAVPIAVKNYKVIISVLAVIAAALTCLGGLMTLCLISLVRKEELKEMGGEAITKDTGTNTSKEQTSVGVQKH